MNNNIYFTAQGTIESSYYKNPEQSLPYTNNNYNFAATDYLGNPGRIEPLNTIANNENICLSGNQQKSSSTFSYIKLSPMISPIYDSGYLQK
jgi:hypothetical protein